MKIQDFACTAIFAEDLRQEVNGQVTIVGILPDNVEFEGQSQAMLPKLCIYVRTVLALTDDAFSPIKVRLEAPSGQPVFESLSSEEFLRSEAKRSADQNAPHLTLISQASMSPFPIRENGRFSVIVEYKDQKYLAGFLNIKLTSAIASQHSLP